MKLQRSSASTIAATLSAAAFALASAAAIASGSMSPSSNQQADAYSMGKSIFFKQVACNACAYAFAAKNSGDIKSVFTELNSKDSKVKLGEDDLEAVNAYLSKRFNLTQMAGK